MFANYLEYYLMSRRNLDKGNTRAACFFLGKAAVYLNEAYQKDEINKNLFAQHLEKIDNQYEACLMK